MAKKINLHYMVLIFLIVLLAVFMGFRSPYFFTAANLCVLVDNFIMEAIMALGMTLVIISGGIDLTVAGVLPFSSIILALFMIQGVPFAAAIMLVLAAAAGIGCLTNLFRKKLNLHPMVVTMAIAAVLKGLNLEVEEGELVSLLGPSGCGKTPALKMINRLIDPNSGHIYIDDKDINTIDKPALRRSIGYVIQQIGLFPNMTVAQNISVVPRLLKYPKEKCDQIVHELLEMVNMPYEQYAHKYPSEMSGGQQQRIGVLRALAASPPIVLMDEPFGALDPMTRTVLQEEVKKLQRKLNKTIIFVTHDMEEAISLADVIIFMDKGEIAQIASPEEMLRNPANDLIRSFLGKHIHDNNETLTISSFLRTNIFKVGADRGILECTELMALHGVDTLLVTDSDDRYLGTVSIEEINEHSQEKLDSIAPLVRRVMPEASITDEAKACFDKLLVKGGNYVVVLNPDQTIAGIVTRSSMARALASAVWGD